MKKEKNEEEEKKQQQTGQDVVGQRCNVDRQTGRQVSYLKTCISCCCLAIGENIGRSLEQNNHPLKGTPVPDYTIRSH